MSGPPTTVLRAWAVRSAEPLVGGQGDAFRAGDLVLKPVAEPERAAALADALEGLSASPGVRISGAARASSGEWVVDGWAAWRWRDGEPWTGTTGELLDVSARFHEAVASVTWSSAMVGHDRWAVADRVAWGEDDGPLPPSLVGLGAARAPVDVPSQLIHGDLAGNVLAHPSLGPAVIDLSPYWRPAAYADAIVLVDRIAWSGESIASIDGWSVAEARQLLIRAVLFRMLAEPEPTTAFDALIARLLA